jgi:hypothetical protein
MRNLVSYEILKDVVNMYRIRKMHKTTTSDNVSVNINGCEIQLTTIAKMNSVFLVLDTERDIIRRNWTSINPLTIVYLFHKEHLRTEKLTDIS